MWSHWPRWIGCSPCGEPAVDNLGKGKVKRKVSGACSVYDAWIVGLTNSVGHRLLLFMPSHHKRPFWTVFLNTAHPPVRLPATEAVPTMAFVPKESWSSELHCLLGWSSTEVVWSSHSWNCKLSLSFLVGFFFFSNSWIQIDSWWSARLKYMTEKQQRKKKNF